MLIGGAYASAALGDSRVKKGVNFPHNPNSQFANVVNLAAVSTGLYNGFTGCGGPPLAAMGIVKITTSLQ
jgi:hypothetical protein